MSGKSKQRTKGNVKPSSSGRTAQLLEKDGGGSLSFVGFGAMSGDLGYVPSLKVGEEYDQDLDDDFRITMRKMTKKDSVTKLKAIQDFGDYCKSKDDKDVLGALPHFPRLYNRLVMDADKRVREGCQHSFQHLIVKCGRNLAPYLKQLMGSWLLGQCDNYPPGALAAKMAFKRAFPSEEKRKGAVGFCSKEILSFIEANLLVETPGTLTDPKTLTPAEQQERYNEVIASTILSFKMFIDLLPEKSLEASQDQLSSLLKQDKLWKYGKNASPYIRSAFFAVLKGLCERFPSVTEDCLSKLSSLALGSLDETDPNVVSNIWQAILVLISRYPMCWQHVNMQKAVLPKVWSLLKQGGGGSAYIIFPNLLPFLSCLPEEVTNDKSSFYRNFFEKMKQGLLGIKGKNATSGEEAAILKAYIECLHFAVSSSVKEGLDAEFIEYILFTELLPCLEGAIKDKQKQSATQVIFLQTSSFLSYLCKVSTTESLINDYLRQFWDKLTDLCLELLKEETPSTDHLHNLAACIADISCPGSSEGFYKKLVRTKSLGKKNRVTFNPTVSFASDEEKNGFDGTQHEEREKKAEFAPSNQVRNNALDNNILFGRFVEALLEYSWCHVDSKQHLAFVADVQYGLQYSGKFYSLMLKINERLEAMNVKAESSLGSTKLHEEPVKEKDTLLQENMDVTLLKKFFDVLVSKISKLEGSEDTRDQIFELFVDMTLRIVVQCPQLDQSVMLDDVLCHLHGLQRVAAFLRKVKNFEEESLKRHWYSSSRFGESLVQLTSDLCRESMSGSGEVPMDCWGLVGMAFETDVEDKPYLDEAYAEQILRIIYQTLQEAHQISQGDETKNRTVNLICNIAASFFSSVKTCIYMPSAEDLLLVLFQLSCRQDFSCSDALKKKIEKTWKSGVEGIVKSTGGFLKVGGFFEKVARWIKTYLFQKRGQLKSIYSLARETCNISHIMFENLPSPESKIGEEEEEAEEKPLNQDEDRERDVLETFIQMVLSTESELQEYASLLNDESFTSLLLKGSMTFDPSQLCSSDLQNTTCFISHAMFISELIQAMYPGSGDSNPPKCCWSSNLRLKWILDMSLARVWCEVTLGCEYEKTLPPEGTFSQIVPQISHPGAVHISAAVDNALKELTKEEWKTLLVHAKQRVEGDHLAQFLVLKYLVRDCQSLTHLAGTDILGLCGGFDRLASLSNFEELQILETILPFISDPQVLLQCHTAILMTTDPVNSSNLTEAFFSLSAISATIPYIPLVELKDVIPLIGTIISHLVQLRESDGGSDLYLFECSLADASKNAILINIKLMQLLTNILILSPSGLKPEHWDFIMCSLVSWSVTCTESLLLERTSLYLAFFTSAFNFLSTVANIMSKALTKEDPNLDIPPDLTTEWTEFFAGGIYDGLLPVFVHCMEQKTEATSTWSLIFMRSFCSAISTTPTDQVKGHKLPARLIPDFPSFIPEEMQSLLNTFCALMELTNRGAIISSYQGLKRVMPDFSQFYEEGVNMSSDSTALDEDEPFIPPPKPFLEILNHSETILDDLFDNVAVGDHLMVSQGSEFYHLCLQYFLCWDLFLTFFGTTKSEVRAQLAAYIKKTESLSILLNILFKTMPSNPTVPASVSPVKKPAKGPATLFSEPLNLQVQALYAPAKDIQHLASSVYQHALQVMPALIRQWWASQDRRIANFVDRYTTMYVSPLLCAQELKGVNFSKQTFENMTVVARVTTREVIATYALQDLSIELVITLPTNHPLGVISVESGKKVGVGAAQWRNWTLQLTTYLTKQNGTIMDGLALWRENVDKRFEGIEECTICFSVIHGANCSLPKIGCRTCKKKFHSACLYKWFKSSNQSTCPLCRSPF
ncbi:E3 ubiquitin-protein ligase listerin [Holothuria leucospilota]|uniref:E3 ubiquitin-protein ligase listerin n=1 Tax=Holothuria leucospilota TaxID=206669 RepID=A0A9Q1BIJ8_HOLLE|nr:E3 ubiquitin-protein ligase listerin [Holothuria leucospilota]